jgi:uncharacterized SAM-binding protein YcdF (DUF218 family)
MLKQHQRTTGRVLVVQDPTMQRRTMATFARVCRDEPVSPQWISHPGFTPTLQNGKEGVEFSEGNTGLWPVDRYLSLVMGSCRACMTTLTAMARPGGILSLTLNSLRPSWPRGNSYSRIRS